MTTLVEKIAAYRKALPEMTVTGEIGIRVMVPILAIIVR